MIIHYTGLSPFPDAVTTEPVSTPTPTVTPTGIKCIHVYPIVLTFEILYQAFIGFIFNLRHCFKMDCLIFLINRHAREKVTTFHPNVLSLQKLMNNACY